MNMKGEKDKNMRNKGITLIALVITIIILLILAGISIAMLIGENGILNQANNAKSKTEEAKEDELRRLTQAEATTHLENYSYKGMYNGKEMTVTIPAGFAVSQVDGENTIDDGLVIIDSKGNEFVWVPVRRDEFDIEFVRRAGYQSGNLQEYTDQYGEADATGENTNIEVKESSKTKKEAQEMYSSVKTNEGFYIGRYESGKDENGEVIIKKGATVYNYVTWSKNGQMNEESEEIADGIDGTKDGAIELSRNFAERNKYVTAISTLCYGVQWDRTLSWINQKFDNFSKDSTGKGNYNEDQNTNKWKGNVSLTGASKNYEVNNIYDLAGNVYEWTMESDRTANNKYVRVRRGGRYDLTGFDYPSSNRLGEYTNACYDKLGFRITLYLR